MRHEQNPAHGAEDLLAELQAVLLRGEVHKGADGLECLLVTKDAVSRAVGMIGDYAILLETVNMLTK